MSFRINSLALASWVLLLLGMGNAHALEPAMPEPNGINPHTLEPVVPESTGINVQALKPSAPESTGIFDKAFCLRCHNMPTLGYRDPVTGGLIKLFVPEEEFKDSNHQGLQCNDCHTAGFEQYPHPAEARQQSLYCVDCHEENPDLIPQQFTQIEKEFKQSVHYQRMPDKFSCFSCHNAHFFKVSRKASDSTRLPDKEVCLGCHVETDFEIGGLQRDISEMVAYDNHICLDCHSEPGRIADLKKGDAPDLEASHDWLPNTQMHWSKVRCID
jgi:hypothetical protein